MLRNNQEVVTRVLTKNLKTTQIYARVINEKIKTDMLALADKLDAYKAV